MKHWNKFLALALCCAMVLSCMPVAWAEGVTTPTDVCAHESFGMNQHWENATYTEIEGDNIYHNVKGDLVDQTFCIDCFEVLKKDVSKDKESKEKHSYDENGTCWTCGHKNSCKHETTREETSKQWNSFVYDEIKGDDLYHTLSYLTYTWTICNDCELCLNGEESTERTSEKENHSYQDGVCLLCGHKNACEHKNTSTMQYLDVAADGEYTFESYDGVFHYIIGSLYEEVYCDDCHAGVSEPKMVQEKARELVPHNTAADGVKCYACGYEPECDHKQKETGSVWYLPDELEYAELNEDEHTVTGSWSTVERCADCKLIIKVLKHEYPHTETEAHEIKDGVCTKCGYKVPEPTAAPTAEPTAAPTTEPEKPTAEPEQPTAEPEKPTAEPEKPTAEPEKPTAEPEKPTAEPAEPEAPTVEPEKPTAEPEQPTAEPEVPTAEPEEPADEPTEAPAAEPTAPEAPDVEPAAEPAAAPMQDMVQELVTELAAAAEEGKEVTVEIVGVDAVLSEEEYQQLVALPVQEQLVVTLASIGYTDVVKAAVEALNITLSDEAAALMDTVTARMDTMTDEEKQAMDAKLAELFPEVEVEIDGETCTFHVIELKIVVDGEETLQKYGFRLDENNVWVFVKL